MRTCKVLIIQMSWACSKLMLSVSGGSEHKYHIILFGNRDNSMQITGTEPYCAATDNQTNAYQSQSNVQSTVPPGHNVAYQVEIKTSLHTYSNCSNNLGNEVKVSGISFDDCNNSITISRLKISHHITYIIQPFYGYILDFVRDNPGEPLPEETLTHSHLSWSSVISYLLPPSITIQDVPDSLFPQYLSKFSLVYLLGWHPPLHTPYISCLLYTSDAADE